MSHLFPLFASVLGLGISLYILQKKLTKTKLICPRESSCDHVVHSVYSNTFGIPNEVLGLIYYSAHILFWLSFSYRASFLNPTLNWVLVVSTILGALFSVYLVAVQALVIRNWCLWCLGSALVNFSLVFFAVTTHFNGFIEILASQKVWWVIVHNIGFILSLGSATITDIFFFRFLNDGKIDEKEKSVMDTLTNTIWIGLAILILSGLMLYLPNQEVLNTSSKFLAKVIIVGVVVLNGLVLNMFVGPEIKKLSFSNSPVPTRFRRFAFALGAVSFTSWYSAFILGSLRRVEFTYLEIIFFYGIILFGAIIASQIFERILSKKYGIKESQINK